ncbi:MAG: hypothetical protein PHU23_16560 [Dehalococcoidales bacterium]|nr:hypothetical protein [Dehalococcoidales bacterium]
MNVQWGDEQPAIDHPEAEATKNGPDPSEENLEPNIGKETRIDAGESPDNNPEDTAADTKVAPEVASTNTSQSETKKPRRETRRKKRNHPCNW